nr:MAG TPA: hypothetical protein [Caudoviricetes sp.]
MTKVIILICEQALVELDSMMVLTVNPCVIHFIN